MSTRPFSWRSRRVILSVRSFRWGRVSDLCPISRNTQLLTSHGPGYVGERVKAKCWGPRRKPGAMDFALFPLKISLRDSKSFLFSI